MLEFDAVRAFCASREVDIVMSPASPPFVLSLHGEFDGYGDFFSIEARDVEFAEIAGGLTVGDMALTQVTELPSLIPAWTRLVGPYSGQALALRSADSEAWGPGCQGFVIVAGHIQFRPGRDWPSQAQ